MTAEVGEQLQVQVPLGLTREAFHLYPRLRQRHCGRYPSSRQCHAVTRLPSRSLAGPRAAVPS
jgi:hypothetical protein